MIVTAFASSFIASDGSRDQEARETCAEIEHLGRRAVAVPADVSLATDVNRLVQAVEADLGPVGILVNNAGVTRPQPIDEISEQDWDEILAINLKSMFLVTQAVLPKMRAARWGRIINLSSVAAPFVSSAALAPPSSEM